MINYLLFKKVRKSQQYLSSHQTQNNLEAIPNDHPVYHTFFDAHQYLHKIRPGVRPVSVKEATYVINETYDNLVCHMNPFLLAKILKKERQCPTYLDCLYEVRSMLDKNIHKFVRLENDMACDAERCEDCIKKGEKNYAAVNRRISRLEKASNKDSQAEQLESNL